MRRLPRQLILCLCALFLIGAQQAAYAHLISHLGHPGHPGQTAAQPADAASHATAACLSHLCATCLAYGALASGAPLPVSLQVADPALAEAPICFEFHRPPLSGAPPYTARAPPFPL